MAQIPVFQIALILIFVLFLNFHQILKIYYFFIIDIINNFCKNEEPTVWIDTVERRCIRCNLNPSNNNMTDCY